MVVIFTDNNNREISLDNLRMHIDQRKLENIQEWIKQTSITNNKDEWIFRLGSGYNEIELKFCNIVQQQASNIPLDLYIPWFVDSIRNPYKVIVVNNKQNNLVCVHSDKIVVCGAIGKSGPDQKYQGKINTDISDMQIIPEEYYREYLRSQHAQTEQSLQGKALYIDGLVKSLDKELIQLINLDKYAWIDKKQADRRRIKGQQFPQMQIKEFSSFMNDLEDEGVDLRVLALMKCQDINNTSRFNSYMQGIQVKSLIDSSYNKSLEKIRIHWNIKRDIEIDSAYEMFNDIDNLVEADINIDMYRGMNKHKIINQKPRQQRI